MNALAHLSDIVIPILIFFIVGYGFVSKVKVYETFLKGAKDGLKIVVDIVPTLIGLLVAVGMLRASGFFEMLGGLLGPAAAAVGLPAQLMPLLVVKLFSSSAATGLVLDIFRTSGPDSYAGMLTSILMSCTDTMLILRGNEEYLQRQDLEFVLIKRVCPLCTLSPVVLDRQS
ncbi:MAG: spore maturation protein [Lachnospiraceae bacterium]|nr:spore maturation protein [Lachnospiraceae bacterium]